MTFEVAEHQELALECPEVLKRFRGILKEAWTAWIRGKQKKVVFFWARSRWGNGFQQKSNYTVCHVCHSQLSWLMSETVQHNVWHGKLKLKPLLEFLTKWYQKDMARHALALSCEFHSENFAGNWHHSYIAYKETHGIYFSCSVSTQKHPRTLYVIRIYSYIIRILDVCTH